MPQREVDKRAGCHTEVVLHCRQSSTTQATARPPLIRFGPSICLWPVYCPKPHMFHFYCLHFVYCFWESEEKRQLCTALNEPFIIWNLKNKYFCCAAAMNTCSCNTKLFYKQAKCHRFVECSFFSIFLLFFLALCRRPVSHRLRNSASKNYVCAAGWMKYVGSALALEIGCREMLNVLVPYCNRF